MDSINLNFKLGHDDMKRRVQLRFENVKQQVLLLAFLLTCSFYVPVHNQQQSSLNRQWLKYKHYVHSIQTGDVAQLEVLQRSLESYQHVLTHRQAQKGIAFEGNNVRVLHWIQSLSSAQNRTVIVGLLAGPSSCEHAEPGPGKPAPAWFETVLQFLRSVHPSIHFTAQYSCFSGEKLVTESGSCFHNDWVEGSALKDLPDVVFVEMTGRERIYPQLNDNPMLQEYEVLLRRLLRGGAGKVTSGIKQPAVVALHMLRPEQISPLPLPGSQFGSTSAYARTYEDMFVTVAQFYDVPFLSLRDALWLDVQPFHEAAIAAAEAGGGVASAGVATKQGAGTNGHAVRALQQQQQVEGVDSTGMNSKDTVRTSTDVEVNVHGGTSRTAHGRSVARLRRPSMHLDLRQGWQAVFTAPHARLTTLGHRIVADLVVYFLQHTMLSHAMLPGIDTSDDDVAVPGLWPTGLPPPMSQYVNDEAVGTCTARVPASVAAFVEEMFAKAQQGAAAAGKAEQAQR